MNPEQLAKIEQEEYIMTAKLLEKELIEEIKAEQANECNVRLKVKDFTYEGEYSNNAINGYGVLYNEDLSMIYVGYFNNNEFHGMGSYYTEDLVYKGEFQTGRFHGKGVIEIPKSNLKFSGEFREGQYYGVMSVHYKNTLIYMGGILNGKYQWRGTRIFLSGVINGMFHCGIPNGTCELVLNNFPGYRYIGHFNGYNIVRGELMTPTGRFEGTFSHNYPSSGTYVTKDFTYEGLFQRNININAKLIIHNVGTIEGKFRNCMPLEGTFYVLNDIVYKGSFNNFRPTTGKYLSITDKNKDCETIVKNLLKKIDTNNRVIFPSVQITVDDIVAYIGDK